MGSSHQGSNPVSCIDRWIFTTRETPPSGLLNFSCLDSWLGPARNTALPFITTPCQQVVFTVNMFWFGTILRAETLSDLFSAVAPKLKMPATLSYWTPGCRMPSTETLGCGEVSEKDRGEFRSGKSGTSSGPDTRVMGRRYRGPCRRNLGAPSEEKGTGAGATAQTLVL